MLRLRFVMPSAVNEPVVFATAVEGVRKAFGKRLKPETLQQLRGIGMNLDDVQAAYPLKTWVDGVGILVADLLPGLSVDEQHRQLGRQFMAGYVQTAIGFATLTTAKLIGVKRTLLRMGRNFRTAANYIETDVTDVGPKEVHLRASVGAEFLSRVPAEATALITNYRRGVLEETLVLLGVEGEVALLEVEAGRPSALFRITWL